MSLSERLKRALPSVIDLAADVFLNGVNLSGMGGERRGQSEELIPDQDFYDRVASETYDRAFRRLGESGEYDLEARVEPEVGGERVYGAEAKSYEGQTDVDYCVECSVKHSQAADMLMTEALQRAAAGEPGDEGVKEKVRGVVRELTGLEDDTEAVGNPVVKALNTMARALRKDIYTSKAEIGGASAQRLEDIKANIGKLVEASYLVREAEECSTCDIDVVKALE